MASVDAELCWGDERLDVGAHPVGAPFDPGAPFGPIAPIHVEGDDVVLVVPPTARAWIHTANGWRDLNTLRILGCVAPDPDVPGAARVRMRRLAGAEGRVEGVVLVARIEAWLEREGFFLRVGLSDDAAPTTRVDGRAIRSLSGFAAFTATLFAGVLSAFGAVPPRQATLDVTRLEPLATRPIPITVLPPDHASRTVETKHRVEPSPAGGRVLGDVMAPARPTPARRTAGRDRDDAGARGGGAGRPGDAGLARMTAAVAALQTLGLDEGPFTNRREGRERHGPIDDREAWLRLATLRGSTGGDLSETRVLSASLRGPLPDGWGRGYGERRVVLPPPVRTRVTGMNDMHVVPHCERRFRCGSAWSCHPCGAGAPVDARARVREIVQQHLGELRFCYDQSRRRVPSLAGRVTLRWRIEEDGATSRVEVVEDALGDAIALGCIRAAPEGWRFDGVGGAVVTYPFVFRAQ